MKSEKDKLKAIIQEEIGKIMSEQSPIRSTAEKIKNFINNAQELPSLIQGFRLDREPTFFLDSISKKPVLYPTYISGDQEIDLTVELKIVQEGDAFKVLMQVRKASFYEDGEKDYI